MTMDRKAIIEALETDEKKEGELSELFDRFIATYSEEIGMLGENKMDRLERHKALGERIAKEIDAHVDLVIRRKDIAMDIKAKLHGNHPEPIDLRIGEMVVFEDKRPGKGKPGKTRFLGFGKAEARTA